MLLRRSPTPIMYSRSSGSIALLATVLHQKMDLSLESYVSTMTGGASGEVLYAKDLTSSQLWLMVSHEISPAMPPGGASFLTQNCRRSRSGSKAACSRKETRRSGRPRRTPSRHSRRPPTIDPKESRRCRKGSRVSRGRSMPSIGWCCDVVGCKSLGARRCRRMPFQISLYNTDSGEHLGVLPFIEGTPYVLQFSRDWQTPLAAGGKSAAVGMAALYDVKTGRRLTTVGDELDAVLAADLRADHGVNC